MRIYRLAMNIAVVFVLTNGALSQATAGERQDEPLSDAPLAVDLTPPSVALLDPWDVVAALEMPQAAAQEPPERRHTGLKALVYGTGSDFAAFPRRRSTWIILGVGAAAAAVAYPFDKELNERARNADGWKTFLAPGKYLGYGWVQGGAALGLLAIGRYALPPAEDGGTNKVAHLGFDLLRATIVTQALTYGVKLAVRRDRPTGECCAFPSGHASITFAAAAVLERHFGYRVSWPMFAVASYVAASRLTDNRHYLSDVLFGAALGMASGWTVVGRHGRNTFSVLPAPVPGGIAVTATWSPHQTLGLR